MSIDRRIRILYDQRWTETINRFRILSKIVNPKNFQMRKYSIIENSIFESEDKEWLNKESDSP